jgi:RNA polymerase-binding transcription factor DksA
VSGYDTSHQHHRLEDAFICDRTADRATQELERGLQDMLRAREEQATRKKVDGRLD